MTLPYHYLNKEKTEFNIIEVQGNKMWFQKTKSQENKVYLLKTIDDRKKEHKAFFKSLKQLAEIALKIATAGGLIIGLSQIHIQLSAQRKDKVMQLFLKQYEEEDNISEIRSNLYSDFVDSSGAYEMLQELNEKYPEETKENIDLAKTAYADFINKFINEDDNRYQEMLILTDFYNGIASCVKSNLCDQKTAKLLFQKEGNTFFQNYYPFFCDIAHKWKDKLLDSNSEKFYNLYNKDKTKSFYEHHCNIQD